MTDVVIQRCVVRVIRHGGWSWGADRPGLVERVARILTQLIAARLAELIGETRGDVEFDEPIRVRVGVGHGAMSQPSTLAAAVRRDVTADDLRQVNAAALAAETTAVEASDDYVRVVLDPASSELSASLPTPTELLLRWRDEGRLWERLACFSTDALALWLGFLVDERAAPGVTTAPLEELRGMVTLFTAGLANVAPPAKPATARLYLAVELAARYPDELSTADLGRLLDEQFPADPSPESRGSTNSATDNDRTFRARLAPAARGAEAHEPITTPGISREQAHQQPAGDVELCSVLPFLVLGELQRIGYLDALSATFHAIRSDRFAAFAAALAYKLLPPPERGWRHPARVQRTASTFAGDPEQIGIAPLSLIEPSADALLSPLDAFLTAELGQGHDPTLPLLITRVFSPDGTGEWLLFDADGGFPVRLTPEVGDLLDPLDRFRGGTVVVSTSAASAPLMQALSERDRTFVTDARPGRGENWRRLAEAPDYWTHAAGHQGLLVEAVRLHAALEVTAQNLFKELQTRRPVLAANAGPALEHSLFLASAAGLGMLAWHLWRDRETTHPVLALERFGDLQGAARYTAGDVQVRMSIGRRYLDLRDNGLLRDIGGVPWLGGRVVRFIGP